MTRSRQALKAWADKPAALSFGSLCFVFRCSIFSIVVGLAFVQAAPVIAQEFKSVSVNAAILYDGPSASAKRVFVAPRGMPVQLISVVEPFVKVRDMSGDTAWVDRRSLGNNRTLIAVGTATLRSAAQDSSAVVVQIERGVMLEVLDASVAGWARVKHSDGQTGFVKISEVWGF